MIRCWPFRVAFQERTPPGACSQKRGIMTSDSYSKFLPPCHMCCTDKGSEMGEESSCQIHHVIPCACRFYKRLRRFYRNPAMPHSRTAAMSVSCTAFDNRRITSAADISTRVELHHWPALCPTPLTPPRQSRGADCTCYSYL